MENEWTVEEWGVLQSYNELKGNLSYSQTEELRSILVSDDIAEGLARFIENHGFDEESDVAEMRNVLEEYWDMMEDGESYELELDEEDA